LGIALDAALNTGDSKAKADLDDTRGHEGGAKIAVWGCPALTDRADGSVRLAG